MKSLEQTIVEPPAKPHLNTPYEVNQSVILGEAGKTETDGDNIYLDLDTILDTRMGTLAKLGNEYAVRTLNSGKYHKRMVDEFEGVSREAFKEAYAKRDLDTLKLSVLTNVVFFLRRLIKDSLISSVIHQRVEKLSFTVNVYPYNFEDEGLVEMLLGCIRFHTYSTSSVRIVSIPDEDLTPEFCSTNFQIMLRYDWVNWAAKHKTYYETKGTPQLSVVSPEIFFDAVPTPDEIEQLQMKKQNPFRMTEEITAALFRLKHMPVSLFSIHESITKETAAELVARAQVTQSDIEDYLSKNYPKATLVSDNPLPEVDLTPAFELL
jgi:hypothetical protein